MTSSSRTPTLEPLANLRWSEQIDHRTMWFQGFDMPPTAVAFVAFVAAVIVILGVVGLVASTWPTLSSKQVLLQHARDAQREPDAAPNASKQVTLYTTNEIKHGAHSCGRPECAQPSAQSCAHYQALLTYLEEFLAKPHADVGRAGPVCPFVPLSLKKQTVLVGMVRTPASSADDGAAATFNVDDMLTLMRRQRERFLQMEPTSGRLKLYKAIVIGFPDIADEDAPRLIDDVQRRLKSEFTQCGMMIGEFHRHNRTPGLRNAGFTPLQTPIPALAIRFMVPTDVLFLKHDPAYLRAYLATIPASASNAPYREEAEQAMQALTGDDGKTK